MIIPLSKRINIDTEKCNGKPIIRQQRITVQTILEFLSAGDTIEDILLSYPTLEKEDIYACLEYAAQVVNRQTMMVSLAT
jgi:uncharacterized protein (DUF433 family)